MSIEPSLQNLEGKQGGEEISPFPINSTRHILPGIKDRPWNLELYYLILHRRFVLNSYDE